MSGILAHPIGQSLALPFAVSMFCSFLIRFFLNGERGQRWAVLAVSAGVLASYLAMLGIPTFPPRFSSQKFFYIVVLVTLASVTCRPSQNLLGKSVFFLTGPIVVIWLSEPTLSWQSPELFAPPILVTGLWLLTFRQFDSLESEGLHGMVILVFAIIGIAIAAKFGGSASITQLALSILASIIGFCSLAWHNHEFSFNRISTLTAVAPLLALISLLVLFGGASVLAMLPLLALLFSTQVAARIFPNRKRSTLALGIICLVPLATSATLTLYLETN